ncbi:ATP-binding protein [Actinokineospora bangkokensis]|uniref:Histidine kinase/HSP90-like ATPase domain-containing protein n=1 Tax=Actinokineospora bangkokensis TaxID=1193682 RepID=A0A1Q9LN85_9PSEU|nr:ATP-binding protein [Actinokineospora bangkokensis]OLR93463.1 hypothetical protein BJP25_14230 [Actinokineospora bangkokensis]
MTDTPATRAPARFTAEIAARSGELAAVRDDLRSWLRSRDASPDLVVDVLLVVDEAMTNSVEHGYRGGVPGPVRVSAELGATALLVVVSDDGCWRPPRPAPDSTRGRGLEIMRAVASAVRLDTSRGTTVSLTIPLDGVS